MQNNDGTADVKGQRTITFKCFLFSGGSKCASNMQRVLPGSICFNSFMCCHTEIEVVDQSCLTQSQYLDIDNRNLKGGWGGGG